MNFSDKELDAINDNFVDVEEVMAEPRKGVPQSRFVIEVTAGTYWDNATNEMLPVPDHLIGHWMMENAGDLRSTYLREAIAGNSWVRCVHKEVITHEWTPV